MPGPGPPTIALMATASSNNIRFACSCRNGSSRSLAQNAAEQDDTAAAYRAVAGRGVSGNKRRESTLLWYGMVRRSGRGFRQNPRRCVGAWQYPALTGSLSIRSYSVICPPGLVAYDYPTYKPLIFY